jgi:hypothetical protein
MRTKPAIKGISILIQRANEDRSELVCSIQLLAGGIPLIDTQGTTHTNQTTIFRARERLGIHALREANVLAGPPKSLYRRMMNAIRSRKKDPWPGIIDQLNDQISDHNALYEGAYSPINRISKTQGTMIHQAMLVQARVIAEVL